MHRAHKTQKFSDYLKSIGYDEVSGKDKRMLVNKHDSAIVIIYNDKPKELIKRSDFKTYPKGMQFLGKSNHRDFVSKCNVGGFGIGKNHARAIQKMTRY